jgi:hypothetical protein
VLVDIFVKLVFAELDFGIDLVTLNDELENVLVGEDAIDEIDVVPDAKLENDRVKVLADGVLEIDDDTGSHCPYLRQSDKISQHVTCTT